MIEKVYYKKKKKKNLDCSANPFVSKMNYK